MALLIFDVDETLCDSAKAYRARGLAVIKLISEKHEVDFSVAQQAFDLLVKIHQQDNNGNVGTRAAIKLGLTRQEFLDALSSSDPALFVSENERLSDALAELAKKHVLVAFSNAPKSAAEKMLKALRIDNNFSKVYGADDFEKSKPNPDAFRKIADENGYSYAQTICIGDSIPKEILPAKLIGAKTILVSVKHHAETALADRTINNITDIRAAVEQLAGTES